MSAASILGRLGDEAQRGRLMQSYVRALLRLGLYLVIGAGAVVFIAPLIWLVSTSLKPNDEILLFPPSHA